MPKCQRSKSKVHLVDVAETNVLRKVQCSLSRSVASAKKQTTILAILGRPRDFSYQLSTCKFDFKQLIHMIECIRFNILAFFYFMHPRRNSVAQQLTLHDRITVRSIIQSSL